MDIVCSSKIKGFFYERFVDYINQGKQIGYVVTSNYINHTFSINQKHITLQIIDESFYREIILYTSLGLGESYIKRRFITNNLYELLVMFIMISNEPSSYINEIYMFILNNTIQCSLFHRNNIHTHYDVHERLYKVMLDKRYMVYTCGYVNKNDNPETITLEKLQTNKMDLICRKLELQNGMRILDIGCGYGGFLIYAAENYNCSGVGFSISKLQTDVGCKLVRQSGVPNVELYEKDLSFLDTIPSNSFDRIVSIACFEHIKTSQYSYVFNNIKRILKPTGKGLIHAIGSVTNPVTHDSFIQTYIFPNSSTMLLSDISCELEKRNMGIVNVENIARHYYYTLKHWLKRSRREFKHNRNLYTSDFKKQWIMYLTMCMAMSKIGSVSLYQVTFNASGNINLSLHSISNV